MLYVLGLLGWMVLGFIVIWAASATHLIKATRSGYKPVEYYWEHQHSVVKGLVRNNNCIAAILWGSVIWPARLVWAINDYYPHLYEQYELLGYKRF